MTPVHARPLRLLVTDAARESLHTPLQALTGQGSQDLPHVEFVSYRQALAQPGCAVDAAFVSRDVTDLSTKQQLTAITRDCYQALQQVQGLRWVHIHSAGADRPIWQALRQRGVVVTNSSGANAHVVAHSALAGLLSLARRLPALRDAQRGHRWAPLMGGPLPRDLLGQTALLVGYGPIGKALAPLLGLLGMKLIIVTTQTPAPGLQARSIALQDLNAAAPQADWLILACPLTAQTRGLVDAPLLAALPAGAGLINVARGEVVVESALVAALGSGRLACAFLDVHEHEPLAADSPLWDMDQVLLTPHCAGHADGNEARVQALFLDNLKRWYSGQPLLNITV